MRKITGLVFVAALAIAIAAAPAGAVSLAGNECYNISVNDRSNIFSDGVPEAALDPVDAGDENRAIFQIDAGNFGAVLLDNHGVPFVNDEGGPAVPPITSNHLQGMLYDLNFTSGSVGGVPAASVGGGGFAADTTTRIFFGAGTRYGPGLGGTDGAWVDTYGVDAAALGVPVGGILIVYDDPTPEAWPGPGPASWSEGTGAPNANMTATDAYPGISDVEPWLIAVLVELPAIKLLALGAPAGTLLAESNSTDSLGAPSSTSGLGFANVIGGKIAPLIKEGVFGFGLDIRIEFDPDFTPQNGWQTGSDDPVQFCTVIPEPTTLALLGLGLVGLPGVIRRKK